jgi:hypothetical protein
MEEEFEVVNVRMPIVNDALLVVVCDGWIGWDVGGIGVWQSNEFLYFVPKWQRLSVEECEISLIGLDWIDRSFVISCCQEWRNISSDSIFENN